MMLTVIHMALMPWLRKYPILSIIRDIRLEDRPTNRQDDTNAVLLLDDNNGADPNNNDSLELRNQCLLQRIVELEEQVSRLLKIESSNHEKELLSFTGKGPSVDTHEAIMIHSSIAGRRRSRRGN